MKKLSLLLFLLITVFFAAAQKKKIDTLRVALSKAKTDTMQFTNLLALSTLYFLPNPDSCIIFGQQGYLIAKKHNWLQDEAYCLNDIANSYGNLGDFAKSIRFYLQALKIAEQSNDMYQVSYLNENIGSDYIQQHDYKKALPYLRLGLKLINTYALSNKLAPDQIMNRAVMYMNSGEYFLYTHQADSAAYYLTISYNDCKKFNIVQVIGGTQRDLGEVEAEKGHKARALQFFGQAVMSDKSADDAEDMSVALLSTANLYHKFKQQDSAEYYAQKALDTAAAGKFQQDVLNAGKALYTFYDEDHNLPQAYKYFKITTAAKDSLYSQDKIKQLLSIDFDEKERRQELETAQREAQKEAENRLRTYILSGGLGVLLLLALIFWRNSNHRKRANTLLQSRNAEIEKQKKSVETTLAELKTTQAHLVQSAKMASLGELTAGIAHEIQNPLNFVNNFSEVSAELFDEMDAELDKGDVAEAKLISADIKQNLEKIHHHGKRADFIVKGMLEHSRASTGERQSTNINSLADEFLKLSYHGLRAKDKSFNAELVTNFDTSIPRLNIVQQDIGRVLVNLYNNAFYAVNQKAKMAGTDYKPEVEVSTVAKGDTIEISVKDNGIGIPEAIKEKIMQPFFTTKPTGEGTGLGLSLTYDMVVKGHGGGYTG
ncbi:MAG TPA: ATP-binding protein [Mucilaginibacter sp.]|nr:ATP-binding protein [Mucilaginibacter sp.]